MIIDQTNGKYEEIKTFAATHPNGKSLTQCFEQLGRIVRNTHTDCAIWIFPDFAPMSLSFALIAAKSAPYELEDIKFNGGIIYHGSHDGFGSGSAPTFSVCLEPTDGWRIHT